MKNYNSSQNKIITFQPNQRSRAIWINRFVFEKKKKPWIDENKRPRKITVIQNDKLFICEIMRKNCQQYFTSILFYYCKTFILCGWIAHHLIENCVNLYFVVVWYIKCILMYEWRHFSWGHVFSAQIELYDLNASILSYDQKLSNFNLLIENHK